MAKKKNSSARYAFIGIIIAIVGCIATGLLALVQGTIALSLYTPPNPETIKVWLSISAAVLVVGLATYAVLAPDTVRRFFTGRQARYGSNALIMALAFLGILFVVNMLTFQNPKVLVDMTENKQHTLAPETLQALANLPDKVTAIAFFSTNTPRDTAAQLLSDFKSNSKGKFDYRFVDPNSDPLLAKQYGVTGDGKIVLTMGKASETAAYADETELDRAMIRLISPQARVIYFLTGHGEPDINGTDNSALSRARETLETKNYTVKTLNLAATNKIPDDAKAIVIAGPQNPLLDQEVSLLKAYVNKGGALVIMEDPTPFTNFGTNPDPLAGYLKSDWGISFDNDVVIDTTSQQPLYAISSQYNTSSSITQHMTSVTIMPQSRSLTLSQTPPQGVTIAPLILTATQSWGETDLAGLQENKQISFDAATDIPGPLTVAATGENSSTNGHVAVFGNSIFATDKGFDAYANGDIFINSVDWAAQEQSLINITPKTPVTRVFNPPQSLQLIIILLSSVIVIPGLVVVAGISTWVARRRQG
ncbi:MAG: GldG family protein [Chloroflexi bacterium]|nr:GldG family protein [Chloroflexota bacterium]